MDLGDYVPKRHFTVEQANNMLPLVRRIVEDLSACYTDLEQKIQTFRSMPSNALQEEKDRVQGEIESQQETLLGYVRELEDLGVELKGPGDGLVDFPCERDGRTVYLCWKLGEPKVEYWHEIDAGYRGRQPIGENFAKSV